MGKTLNTRPNRARTEEYVEHHDHRKGECDLPTLEHYLKHCEGTRWKRAHDTRCTWEVDWYKRHDTRCSCELCRDPWWADFKKKKQAGPMPTMDDY